MISIVNINVDRSNENLLKPITCMLMIDKLYKNNTDQEMIFIHKFPLTFYVNHDICEDKINDNGDYISCSSIQLSVDRCFQLVPERKDLLIEERLTLSRINDPFLEWEMQLTFQDRIQYGGKSFHPLANTTRVVIPSSFLNNHLMHVGVLSAYCCLMWIMLLLGRLRKTSM